MTPVRAFPWLYPYQEDGPRRESVVLRPVVPITLVGTDVAPTALALVDSGSEHLLAAPWLAVAAGVDPDASGDRLSLGIGGDTVGARFVSLTLRLHPVGADDDEFVDWQADVGFVTTWRPTWPMLLGQVGFLDRFTVTMSRQAQLTAVEKWEMFDQRFGVPVA